MLSPLRRALLLAPLACGAARLVRAAPPQGRNVAIGVLIATGPDAPARSYLEPALKRRGYEPGRNLRLEYRFGENQYERLDALAAELVASKVDLILAAGTPPTIAARKAAGTLPIITVGSTNPIAQGWAASLARPGGNVTGVINSSLDVVRKGMEFLRALVPKARRVGMLANPDNPASAISGQYVSEFGVEIVPITFRRPADLEAGLGTARVDALYVRLDATLNVNAAAIARFALAQRLPAMGSLREFTTAGGLASYGQSYDEQWDIAAEYVDRIVNGAKASDLPIVQPSRFELGVNRRTAAALGIAIPAEILLRAEIVVE